MYQHGYGLPALIVAFLAGFMVAQFFTLQPRADIRITPPISTQRNR
jgi:hypothetical protein